MQEYIRPLTLSNAAYTVVGKKKNNWVDALDQGTCIYRKLENVGWQILF